MEIEVVGYCKAQKQHSQDKEISFRFEPEVCQTALHLEHATHKTQPSNVEKQTFDWDITSSQFGQSNVKKFAWDANDSTKVNSTLFFTDGPKAHKVNVALSNNILVITLNYGHMANNTCM